MPAHMMPVLLNMDFKSLANSLTDLFLVEHRWDNARIAALADLQCLQYYLYKCKMQGIRYRKIVFAVYQIVCMLDDGPVLV